MEINNIIVDFSTLLIGYINQLRQHFNIHQIHTISVDKIYDLSNNNYHVIIKVIPLSFLSHFYFHQNVVQ